MRKEAIRVKDLTPKDHAEAVATFRHAVIGSVCARELSRGELAEALRQLALVRVRPPGSLRTKMYSVRRSSAGSTRTAAEGCRRCSLVGEAIEGAAAICQTRCASSCATSDASIPVLRRA